jgi:hypothetical protein
MNTIGMGYGGLPFLPPFVGIGLVLLIVWSLVWKGLALWRAAKRGEKFWFILFLIVNTAGILEIIYLFLVTGAKLSDFKLPDGSHHEHNHTH